MSRSNKASGSQLDEVFIPDPSDLVGSIILVFSKPKLAFFTDDIEDLEQSVDQHFASAGSGGFLILTSPAT